MDNLFFIYNNVKYLVEYINSTRILYKEVNNSKEELNDIEKYDINHALNKEYGYNYSSNILYNMVYRNNGIQSREQLFNFLEWLERMIPEECRSNLYRNVQTLKTQLNSDLGVHNDSTYESGSATAFGYNTLTNSLVISQKSVSELWQKAQTTSNPQEYYSRRYSQALLHELAHMSSSYYDEQTGISLCGFDKYPSDNIDDNNRGLTEGFTEIVSSPPTSVAEEEYSKYYIEECLIRQMSILIGNEVFIKSYFSNLGTNLLQAQLNQIIDIPEKSYNLFRNIETNYNIRNLCEEQNILGYVQSTLLDYLDAKLEMMLETSDLHEISKVLQTYESVLVTPEKIKKMDLNSHGYFGVAESISKYDAIKTKCLLHLRDNRKTSL